ncbi:hypothetical protein LPJ53_002499 [Coemansia erecta]|uniref:Swi5-dependent recombination DNA repair protein 1 n=1 Tax=Coemansia erecta TaxID=147472 RepID=A0A9W7Y454_9FUNG|nr:hypothetical protein LPJ53_002499 [Coemansia erecta]
MQPHSRRASLNALRKPFKSPKKDAADPAGVSTPPRKAHTKSVLSTPKTPKALSSSLPPKKRLRTATPIRTATSPRSRPLLFSTDTETRALIQERASLQRQIKDAKAENSLLERAATLKEKDEIAAVDKLIAKWQIACASACDDLFELLKPVMDAQRQSAELGFGGSGFDDRPLNPPAKTGSGEDGSGSDDTDDMSGDIDIQYMLKHLGIDPELF